MAKEWYVQCPHCKELHAVSSRIPKSAVCLTCGKRYVTSEENVLKRPSLIPIHVAGILVVGAAACVVSRYLNGYAPASDLIIAFVAALATLGVTVWCDAVRNAFERCLREHGIGELKREVYMKRGENMNKARNVEITIDIRDEGYSKELARKLTRFLSEENERLRDRGCGTLSCEIRRRKDHHMSE